MGDVETRLLAVLARIRHVKERSKLHDSSTVSRMEMVCRVAGATACCWGMAAEDVGGHVPV
jgi:hypothetical protein